MTTDTSAWYFSSGIGVVAVVLAIAGYGLFTSLGTKPVRPAT